MTTTFLPFNATTPPKLPEIAKKPPKPKLLSKRPDPSPLDTHLTRLCESGRLTEAIASLPSIVQSGSTVRANTLTQLIDSCVESNSLELCHKLNTHVKKLLRDGQNLTVETKLVSMYAKCGSLEDAYKVFDEMPERNLFTWSAIIGACARERRWDDVVSLFYNMMAVDGLVPDSFLFPKILQACGNCADIKTGRLVHGIVVKCGMLDADGDGEASVRVSNSVLAVYAKCGSLDYAEKFFNAMEVKDRVSWNSMITGYCQSGNVGKARKLFELMRREGVEPGVVTWNILISSCCKLGRCNEAIEMVKEMELLGIVPDVFTWTSIISGCNQNNRPIEALELFKQMVLAGTEPNEVTLMSVISACAALKDLRKGKEFHLMAMKLGYGEDVLVGNSLIDMYSKCTKIEAARRVFDVVLDKDVYTWNSMIGGYCQAGYCGKAHNLFLKMQESGILPNVITWNVMITGYIQNGDEDQAMDLFQRMENEGVVKRDTASWNALIAGYLQHGQKDKALAIFRQMQSAGVRPNSVTILSILPACSNLIAAKKVKEIHCCIIRHDLEAEISVMNSLIDTCAKSRNVTYSRMVFDRMLTKDVITWNTMINSYVIHGCSYEAIELYEHMGKNGYKPNRGTFVSMILAYARAKMVDEGKRVFTSMVEDYRIVPYLDHCAAMVSLFGLSGMLDEAVEFIEEMGISPDVSIWLALLTACRAHGDAKLAVHVCERLLELEPENYSTYWLLVQLYDLCEIPKDSLKAKRPGKRNEAIETLGCSWIEDGNTVQTFCAGDDCGPGSEHLFSWMKSVELEMRARKRSNGLCIMEEGLEEDVGVHSEKLALAYALGNGSKANRDIRIVKNTRTCEHCHEVTKLVSRKYQREIYLSDSKCLHHFKDGSCSCGDYW